MRTGTHLGLLATVAEQVIIPHAKQVVTEFVRHQASGISQDMHLERDTLACFVQFQRAVLRIERRARYAARVKVRLIRGGSIHAQD